MKVLTDTTFYKKDFSEGAWDMLDDEERKELRAMVDAEKDEKRLMMAKRGKARLEW